ncbi:penicillin-binding protein 1B [Lysobacter yananisis]|uniref:Penicillin-binding protein 1B n=1 Tax=Lysobacter yananisis TaxID=1003114 RepID=A0ABY9PFJ0_9GAMM|nr:MULTISPECIES: penicillin-binding protein 1B [Lysobacter]UZW63256.1 penicillin-binding protein 1B [Lysobacter enzymogenes]WMT05828.1 penicillin-binding protein 1B [Lysobacter yananisis]
MDYDEDERDDNDGQGAKPGWRRRLVTWTLAAGGLGLGFLIPYTLYLNHEVGERFGQLQWQIPTRVYARPLEVAPGAALDAATLKTELDAASYREDGGERPGTYAREGGRFTIASRGFDDVDGTVQPRRIEVSIAGGRVAAVRDLTSKKALRTARLDPARIATLYGQKQEERRLVRIEEVPELLVTGLQAVEDRDFNHHFGIDLSGMARAAFKNVAAGRAKQGASTLTQQLARSGLLGIGQEQTLTRKGKEIIYALLIEARYDKRTILEAYFNQVYLGQRGSQAIHGVAAASEFWFGRDLRDLNTEQIALLIGIVRGPSYYDPRRNPERALSRRNFVLGEMHETGLIAEAEYQRAIKTPLEISQNPGNIAANRFPAYVDLIRRQLARDYPADALAGAGLSVMSGMQPSAQAQAEGAVARTLKSLDNKRRPPLQAGLVVTDVHNGEVVAVVGSREFTQPGFNRAVEAQRPVGSLLKPFVYLLALARPSEFNLSTWVDDSPVTVKLGRGRNWNPGNSDGRSHGLVRMVDALAMSYNQATVRIGMQVSPEAVGELTQKLAGIQAPNNPSLILGAVDQSPYAMAQLYQFLASGGEVQPLHAVRGVLDAQGKAVKRYDKEPAPAQEGDAIAARLITIALQQAVTNGTGRQLIGDGLGKLQPAGKTGTSNDGRDSWFAGWTGDHLAVIWVGNDQNQTTGLYGATGAMRVWSAIFSRLPTAPLQVTDKGIDWQPVVGSNSTDAACPGARRFPFVAGFAPQYAPCPQPEPQAEESGGGWREWFGIGKDKDESAREPAPTPPSPEQ